MTENDASGNRWEPSTEQDPGPAAEAVRPEEAATPDAPASPTEGPRDLFTRSTWASRGRTVAAAAAAAVFLVGGASGFAVGRATGDGSDSGRGGFGTQQGFPPGGFDQDGDHGPGGGLGRGGPDGGFGSGPGTSQSPEQDSSSGTSS